ERSFIDLPGQDGVFAGQIHFGVGETGADPHVTSAGFDILAAYRLCCRDGYRSSKHHESGEQKAGLHINDLLENESRMVTGATLDMVKTSRHPVKGQRNRVTTAGFHFS